MTSKINRSLKISICIEIFSTVLSMYFLGEHPLNICFIIALFLLFFSFSLLKLSLLYNESINQELVFNNRYTTLISNIKEILICLDKNFCINLVTKQFKVIGDNYIGKCVDQYQFVDFKLLKESILKGISCEWKWEDKNNKKFYQMYAEEISKIDENYSILIICHDITDQVVSKENEMRMMKAETALQSKIGFIASISHELRNPLQAAIYSCENLSNLNLNNEQQSVLNDIKSSNRLLTNIIDDVLDLSKIESEKMVVHSSPMNILNVCEKSLELNLIGAKKKDLNLLFIFDVDLPVHIDSDQLRVIQILNNLISNAIKYSDKGYIFLECKRIKKYDQFFVKISVEDQGIGIDHEDIKLLFTPFQKCKNGIGKGWGLGLSICKKLSILLDSEISVKSNIGKGSTFSLDIPLRNPSQETIKTQFSIPMFKNVEIYHSNMRYLIFMKELFELYGSKVIKFQIDLKDVVKSDHMLLIDESLIQKELMTNGIILGYERHNNFKNLTISSKLFHLFSDSLNLKISEKVIKNFSGKKVLICEDNSIIHKSLFKLLQNNSNFEIESSFNGKEAVEKCIEKFFHFILMDIQMPIMDGIEATNKIREHQYHSKLKSKIICISGNVFENDSKKEMKFNEVLSKPITKDKLMEVFEKLSID